MRPLGTAKVNGFDMRRAIGWVRGKGKELADEKGAGDSAVMHMADVAGAFEWQARHAEAMGSHVTARVVRSFAPMLKSGLMIGERMRGWPGLTLEDAMPLRLAGGFHNLRLTGADDRLGPIYRGELSDQSEVDAVMLAVARAHDARLLPWLDGPPQTNEAGRSAGIMAQLLWLSGRLGPNFELNELGASAGINTMLDRFDYDLGGVHAGRAGPPLRIAPEWRGAPPPDVPVEIVSIRGCDPTPMDLTDPADALRLKSYVWPDVPARLARINAAIALATEQAPQVEQMDAGQFVAERLAAPQEAGVTRTFFHSIVWQYIPAEKRDRIEAMIEAAGAAATPERPIAWVMVETNRETFRHELRTRYWPGGGEQWSLLGQAHAHGAWVEWFGDA